MLSSGLIEQDLQILRDIITTATESNDGTSFLAVFKAYDTVLKARNIDPVNDRVYFKFLLKLARIEGATWLEKFESVARVIPHYPRWTHSLSRAMTKKIKTRQFP